MKFEESLTGSRTAWQQYGLALLVVGGTSLLNLTLENWIGYAASALIYLLAVVFLARCVDRGPILFGTTLTALGWNFFFCPPKYSFHITSTYDKMMLVTYFVVALTVGQLTARLRAEKQLEAQREQSSSALYHLTSELAVAKDGADFLMRAAGQASTVFGGTVTFLLSGANMISLQAIGLETEWCKEEREHKAALQALETNRPTGHGTDTPLGAVGLYLPLSAGSAPAGVMASKPNGDRGWEPHQVNLQESFARQIALLLDRQRLSQAEIQTRLLAESERLGRTLLNSVSHELRTPLAAISSAVSSLQGTNPLSPVQQRLAQELETAAARLNRVVQSLLSAARLQSGHLQPRLDWCDVSDLIRVTRRSVADILAGREVQVNVAAGLPLIRADFVLLEQALANLLVNASMHTPPGTPIEITAKANDKEMCLEVADRGPGVASNDLERIFDRFHRGTKAKPGGTGLGLAIVKGFIESQGGRVQAANRAEGGTLFCIWLPLTAQPELKEEIA